MTKTCASCKKEFETESESQEYCSGACMAKAKRDRLLAKKNLKKKKAAKRTKINVKTAKDMCKIFSEPDFSETTPDERTDEEKELDAKAEFITAADGVSVPVPLFQSHTPWLAAIEAYCEEQNITPQDLIDFHKAGQKAKAPKKHDPTLSYFEIRQLKNQGL